MNLTDDDKKWITEQLAPFATKVDLQRMEAKLERFATKAELEGVEARLEAKLERFATKEELERVETNLLTEFHKWASPIDARLRTHTAMLRAIDLEMESMSDRIQKLEGPGPS